MRSLIKDVEAIATFDREGRELQSGWLLVEGNRIAALGEGEPPPGPYDQVIDGRGKVLLPGICLLYTSPSPRD